MGGGGGITDFPACISSCAETPGCVAANFYYAGGLVCQFIESISNVYEIDTQGAVLASINSGGQYTPTK